jgi:hypothetical protein
MVRGWRGVSEQISPVDYSCPEWDSDVRIVHLATGLYRVDVLHDDHCPWLGRNERLGGK